LWFFLEVLVTLWFGYMWFLALACRILKS